MVNKSARGRYGWRGLSWTMRTAFIGIPLVMAAACTNGASTQTSSGTGPASTSTPATAAPVAATPCDTSLNPTAFYADAKVAGTIDTAHPAMDPNMPGMDHSNPGTSAKPMDMSGGMGEVEAAKVMIQLNQMSEADYQKWLEGLNPKRAAGAPDDTGMGGHLGPQTWTHITDPATCQKVSAELDQAKAVAKKYPKASDAIADGYVRVAPYLSGIASHWMKFSLVDTKFDVNTPEMLLYDGNDETANLVGLSYFIRQDANDEPTVGFTGDNDHYHRHEGLCVSGNGVIGDSTTSPEECAALGGKKQNGASGWMSHAWIVPGCESPWGVFSAQNPILDMPLVDKSGQGTPCSGSQVKSRWEIAAPPG